MPPDSFDVIDVALAAARAFDASGESLDAADLDHWAPALGVEESLAAARAEAWRGQ